jgi:hypothetical protein
MISTVKAYSLVGFGVVPELPRAAVLLGRFYCRITLPRTLAVPDGRSNHERDS